MMPTRDATALLIDWRDGNRAALDELFPLVYEDLRRRAHGALGGERPGHTLTTTALVHETYLKLLDVERVRWQDRVHFMAVASTAMRRVLVSYARRHRATKRGGGRTPQSLDSENLLQDDAAAMSAERADRIIGLDQALLKLAALNERLSRTVELHFFGGMSFEEIAEVLDVTSRTVKRDWQKAKAFLYREIG